MKETERAMSYEVLFKEVMGRPIPRQGFVLPNHPIDLLRRDDENVDPYKRWVEAQQFLTRQGTELSD